MDIFFQIMVRTIGGDDNTEKQNHYLIPIKKVSIANHF